VGLDGTPALLPHARLSDRASPSTLRR
jgi:hypothetical protein